MKGFWFIVEFYGPDMWDDLRIWSELSNKMHNIYVDYEYQTVWFEVDLNAI